MTNSKTIVFIHGLFQNPNSWTEWKYYFEAKGYTCYTPAFAYHEGEPAELRKNINQALGQITFKEVVDSLSNFIDKLSDKPIIIGHSLGGIVTQKLISLDKGVAGICVSSGPPKGLISLKWSFLKANLPVINPFKGNSVFLPSLKWFHYAFCNMMTMEQTEMIYNKSVVPESRNIPRGSTTNDGKIDFKKPHKPLLFIAGEKDNIIPVSLIEKNYNAYKDTNSKKDFKVFANRTHYICGQENWQEIASYISEWISKL